MTTTARGAAGCQDWKCENPEELEAGLAEDDGAEGEHERRKAECLSRNHRVARRFPVYTDADIAVRS
jgi:hypothetical protein